MKKYSIYIISALFVFILWFQYSLSARDASSLTLDSSEYSQHVERALSGNKNDAARIMHFYLYESGKDLKPAFVPKLWIHIAAVLGDEEALKLLHSDEKNSLECILKEYSKMIETSGGSIDAIYLLYHYHLANNNKEEAERKLKILKKFNVDERLLKVYK